MPTAGPETFLEILENFLGRQIDWNSSLITQLVKNTPAKQKTRVQFLDWGDPLEKEMATPSSILAWRIPWTEKPSRLHSMGSQESDMTEQLSTLWQYSLKAEATGKYSYYYSLYKYFLHFNFLLLFFIILIFICYFFLILFKKYFYIIFPISTGLFHYIAIFPCFVFSFVLCCFYLIFNNILYFYIFTLLWSLYFFPFVFISLLFLQFSFLLVVTSPCWFFFFF